MDYSIHNVSKSKNSSKKNKFKFFEGDQDVQKSKIFRISLIVLAVYTCFTCAAIQMDISMRKETIETIKANIEYQEYLNSQFLSALESGSDTEYIINIARDKLGFVFPDERVFIDPNRKQ